jgi:hypothetical protein
MREDKKDRREITNFPPQVGELIIRKLSIIRGKEKDFEQVNETLGYFDEINKPGENWHFQEIAQDKYATKSYEPHFSSSVESATEGPVVSWNSFTKVEYSQATQPELEKYLGSIKNFFESRNPGQGEHDLQSWTSEVCSNPTLQTKEKTRIQLAQVKVIGK